MKKISLQWKLTLLTTVLITILCGCLTFFLYKNGVYYFDTLQESITDQGTAPEAVYIDIPDNEWDDFVEATKLKAVLLAPILSGALSSGIQFILTANSGKLKGFDEITKFAKATTDGLLVGNPGSTGIFGTVAAKELPQLSDGLLFHNGAYVRIRIPKCEDREE